MITGDNEKTAVAIAKEARILPENWVPSANDYSVMTGKNFREFVGGLIKKEGEETRVGNM